MRRLLLIFACLAGMLSCSRGERVIPADKMAAMFEEMFVLDQWIRTDNRLARMADTSLVYAPILERYGYTAEDYYHSVEYYLSEPAEFTEIFQTVKGRLDRRVEELTALEEGITQRDAHRRAIEARTDFRRARIFDFGDTLDLTRKVSVVWDSLGISVVERALPDTLYDGPVFHLRDSVKIVENEESSSEIPVSADRG